MQLSLQEIAGRLGARLHHISAEAAKTRFVSGLASPGSATPDDLIVLFQARYLPSALQSAACAVVTSAAHVNDFSVPVLEVDHPYTALALLSRAFEYRSHSPGPGISPQAAVGEGTYISSDASIGPFVSVGSNVHIGAGVVIGAGTVIADGAAIGEGTLIEPQAFIGHHVRIGRDCRIHSGARIGCEGFGFAPDAGSWQRIAQLGSVVIGNNCRIGANSTIDRGAMDDTCIGDNVIIDNLVQIAHNVRIGNGTAIAACAAIAGSTVIGQNCIIGGATAIAGHIKIADGATFTGMSMVTSSVTSPGTYASGTGLFPAAHWRRMVVGLRNLPQQLGKISQLEKAVFSSVPPSNLP